MMNIPTNFSLGSSSRGGGATGGRNSGSPGEGPWGACKVLKKKCVPGCIFAPYFDSEQGLTHFTNVQKVFGTRKVSELLLHIPIHERFHAVATLCYQAQARIRDPVYGCVGDIISLEQQVVNLQREISYLQAHLPTLQLPPSQPHLMMSPPLSVGDLPMASSFPVAYDISMLFDPEMQQPHAGATQQHPPPTVVHQRQQRQVDDDHFMEGCSPTSIARGGGNGGLEAIAGEFMLPYLGRPSPTSSAIGNPLFE